MSFKDRVTDRIPKSSDKNELKPCPFCGGSATLREVKIVCDSCGVTIKGATITIVVGKWNRRKNEI